MSPFRKLWLAQAISVLGDFVAVFAVQVAVVFRMHGSPGEMAGVFVASLLPSAILGPLAGVFADRWNPRRVMIASDLFRAVAVALLVFAVNLPQIYVISFAVSCASSFFSPAQTIAIPLLVSREKLLRSAALMQQTMQVMRIASPAVAAALATSLGETACYWADAFSFVFSATMLATLDLPIISRGDGSRRVRDVAAEFMAGLRFILTNAQFSFVAVAMTTGTFAAGCFGALASLYVRDTLHADVAVFGVMGSLIGVGTIIGSALASWLAKYREPTQLVSAGMAVVGASIFLISELPRRAIAWTGATGIGFGVAMVLLGCTVMLQGRTPPELRGRVSGATGALASLAQLAAMFFAGAWAARVGIRGVFFCSATLLLIVGAGTLFAKRRHLNLNETDGAILREDTA